MKDLFIEDYELVNEYVQGQSICDKCALINTSLCKSEAASICLWAENSEMVFKLKIQNNG